MLGDHLQEAVAAVGVHHRVDDHHQLVEQPPDRLAAARRQVVDHRQRGVGARGLVAVDRVGQPGDRRQLVEQPRALALREAARVGQPCPAGADLVEAAVVGGRGEDHGVQRAALVAAGVLLEPRPRAGRRPALEAGLDLVREGGPVAGPEAEAVLGGRHRRVVVAAREELLVVREAGQLGGGEPGGGDRRQEGQQQPEEAGGGGWQPGPSHGEGSFVERRHPMAESRGRRPAAAG